MSMKGVLIILLVSVLSLISCSDLYGQEPKKGSVHNVDERKRTILYKGSYALLIGITEYEHWTDLKSIPDEMSNLESALEKHGFIVKKPENYTCEQLKKTIDQFINDYGFKENNRLLFFFSGHGYTRKRRGSKIGYIIPADASLPIDSIKFVRSAIEMDQILTWAKRIESKHALFVFDSCFSGTVFKSRNVTIPSEITYLARMHVRQFITAGDAVETVPARSNFTPCFINGIEGKADLTNDGYITGTELGLYLRKEVLRYKEGHTPQFGKIKDPELEEGDFVFKWTPPLPKINDFEIRGIPEKVAASHVSPHVSVKSDTLYENLYLLPITEDVDEKKYRISMGERIVFDYKNNQYQFEWKDGLVYAGGEVIDRNGKEFKIHFFIVLNDVYEKILPNSRLNEKTLGEAISKEQFDDVSVSAIKAKKVPFYRNKTK